jgi:hypothetical protein
MKAIFRFFKRKLDAIKLKFEKSDGMQYLEYMKELNPDLQKNINSWSSSVAKEMETQLFMLRDLQRKLDDLKMKK